jgi:hypothetical protein
MELLGLVKRKYQPVGAAITTQLVMPILMHLNDGAGLSTIVAQGNIGSNVGGTEAKTYSVTANGTS